MLENMYNKKVLRYFRHPKNIGRIKNPDGIGTVGNPICGDIMKVYIKVGQKNGNYYIKDIKVETLGCGAAIATSSIATELIKGKSLDQALKLTNKAVADALGGLPKIKMHCSVLAEEGIKKAIESYKKKSKIKSQKSKS